MKMTLITTGIISGQSAFEIFKQISKNNGDNFHNIILKEIHLKFDSISFNSVGDGLLDHYYKIKKISNCKLEATLKLSTDTTKYFLYKEMFDNEYCSLTLKLNSTLYQIKIENIFNVQINVLLEPLLNLRNCYSIEEALMNWALNNKFMVQQNYIKHGKILDDLGLYKPKHFEKYLSYFLGCENIIKFVPNKFKNKVLNIQKTKQNNPVEFMTTIDLINKFFINKVKKYHKKEKIYKLGSFNLNFSFELYGSKDEVYHPTNRKSLYLVKKDGYLHLKSFAILFNLRWFFNTRYNSKKVLGLNKEYGITNHGYGQTLYKYDDVLLWLITHPNAIENVELVVLDPIPFNYIF